MSFETAAAQARRSAALPHATHVLVCGATPSAVASALLLRRLGEAVTLLADDLRAEGRQALERAGVRIVTGRPNDPHALAEARADHARSAVVAAAGDLSSVEVTLAVRNAYPALPVVCCVHQPELAARLERSLGARAAVCVSAIEAVHLAGCAIATGVLGAFALGNDLVLLRRLHAAADAHEDVRRLEQRTGTRVLMVEQADGRCVIAPSAAFPIASNDLVTVVDHRPVTRPPRLARTVARAARTIRANTPPALGRTAAVLALLAALSVFGFMAGMNIPFSDAAYLVLNTISTVGYGDITPFRTGPLMHLFGSLVALLGPALLGAVLLIFARVLLRPQRIVSPSADHVIVVAPPPVAAATAAQLGHLSVESVIASPRESIDALLRECNAHAARALVAATNDPVTNVTLSLAAREINPAIHVVAQTPAAIARDTAVTVPVSAMATSISVAASAALVPGLRYAVTIGDRVFSFFDGTAGADWGGQRPSEVSGSYNFVSLFRRGSGGSWRRADYDGAFAEDETVLVAAWRRI